MKVNQVQQDYQRQNVNNFEKTRSYNNLSFKRGLPEKITDLLPDKKTIKFMNEKLGWVRGEIGGVAMTAIGTGLVSPWPIAFNPFVKAPKGATEEEKQEVKYTKYYTAMRQILSAITAAIFQIGALQPIDRALDYIYNTPNLAQHFDIDTNQSLLNNQKFIERKVKKEMQREGLTTNMGKEQYAKILKERVAKVEQEQIEDFINKFKETHEIIVGKGQIDNFKVANIVNKEIDGYIADAKYLKISKESISYLENVFKDISNDPTKLKEHLNKLLTKETNNETKKLIEELLDKVVDIDAKEICNNKFNVSQFTEALTNRNSELEKIIKNLDNSKIKDVTNATPENIKEAIKRATENCVLDSKNSIQNSILKDASTFGIQKENLSKKVYKDIANGYKKFVENSYKSPNQLCKILIGIFITLPITCSVLNWIYPRFMEKFFPKWSGAKAKSKEKEMEVK
ncbi:hypothetical protein IKB17_02260 [bacterium]|nr:hypothetical protein [bacterium]